MAINNKSGKIIVVEGLWGIGKTTLAKKLALKNRAAYISEPSHLKLKKTPKDIQDWYWRQFLRREKRAEKYAKMGRNVVLDRGRLSVIAYTWALGKKYKKSAKFLSRARNYPGIKPDILILVEPRDGKIFSFLADEHNKKHYRTPNLTNNQRFIRKYYQGLHRWIGILQSGSIVKKTAARIRN